MKKLSKSKWNDFYQTSETKMKKQISTLILGLLFCLTMNAQVSNTTKVPLESVVGEPFSGSLWKVQVAEDYSFLKNIPDIECDLHTIGSFKLNQYIGKDSIENQMYLFVGVNEKKKEKYVIVDTNNNHDFLDDKLYTFALPQKPLTRDEKKERAVGLEITLDAEKNIFANVGIDPFNYFGYGYESTQDKRLEVIIVFTDYMQAKIQIEDIPLKIDANGSANLFQKKINNKTDFRVSYTDKAGKPSNKGFKIGDTLHINDKLLLLSEIEHPNIYFKSLGSLVDSSTVGSFIPAIYAKNRETNDDISINDLVKNKYVFIDFWGSWCGPCVSSIPKLKELYSKLKDRDDVMMLGIALEKEKDLEKLKTIMSEKEIGWTNFWVKSEDSKISTSIIKKMDIRSYPTYVIIDKEGKIVYRQNSSLKTQEAVDFFLNLIEE